MSHAIEVSLTEGVKIDGVQFEGVTEISFFANAYGESKAVLTIDPQHWDDHMLKAEVKEIHVIKDQDD